MWGRFINADSESVLSASPGSATWDKNLYAYCDNNPVNRKDDGGAYWHIIAGGLVGGISSFAATMLVDKGDITSAFISAVYGFAAGALSAAIPGASMAIDIGAGIAEDLFKASLFHHTRGEEFSFGFGDASLSGGIEFWQVLLEKTTY